MSRGLIRVLLAACVAALMLSAGSAGAKLTPSVTLKVAKHKDGPYDYVQAINVPVGESKNLYFKAKNDTDERVHAKLDDDGSSSGLENFTVGWFKGERNISGAVKGSGYGFRLKAKRQAIFRAKLTHSDPGDGFCLEGNLHHGDTTAFAGASVNRKCIF